MNSAIDLTDEKPRLTIRTREVRECPLCGGGGTLLYEDITDRLYNAPGKWCTRVCRQDTCGLLWIDPMPIEEDIHKAYTRYHTHENSLSRMPSAVREVVRWVDRGYIAFKFGYNAQSLPAFQKVIGLFLFLHPLRRLMLDRDVRYLHADRCGKVLDVGCGSGEWASFMKTLDVDIEGLDSDPLAIQTAQRKGISAHVGSLEEAQYPDDTFDLVNLSHVIEHVPNPAETLRECKRILKPQGVVAIVTPNTESFGHKIFKENWRGLEPPRHLHLMNAGNLRQIVATAGLAEIKTCFYGFGGTFRESYILSRRSSLGRSPQTSRFVESLVVNSLSAIEIINMVFSRSSGQHLFMLAQKNSKVSQSDNTKCVLRN